MTRARLYPHRPPDPQALAAEIADTRAALGQTVSALAAKADVKARMTDRLSSVKAKTADMGRHNRMPLIGAAAGAGVAVVVFLVARRLRR